MADSLRDYFIRFLFKTDESGLAKIKQGISSIEQSLDRAGQKAFSFNEKIAAIRNVIAPFKMLGNLVAHTADEADKLQELSDRTGIATAALEKMGYVAEMNGTTLETMTTGMRHLEKAMGGALDGSKQQAQTFAKLGVQVHGAGGKIKTVEEMLPDISKAFQKLPSHAQKSAYAMELFGRAGQELLPMLEKGPDAIRKMQDELEMLGGVTSERFLKAAGEWDDNIHSLTAAWKGVRQAVSGPIVEAINKVAASFLVWWKVSGQLVRSKISEWMKHFVDSAKALWLMLTKIGGALLLVAAALNVPMLAMIAMHLLIFLIIEDFAHFLAGNDSLIGRLIKNWDKAVESLEKTHPVLAKLLKAFGNWAKGLKKDLEEIDLSVQGVQDAFHGLAKFGNDWWIQPIVEAFEKIQIAIYDSLINFKKLAQVAGFNGLAKSLGSAAASTINGGKGDAEDQKTEARIQALMKATGRDRSAVLDVMYPGRFGAGTSSSQTDLLGTGIDRLKGMFGGGGKSVTTGPVTMNITAAPGMNERTFVEEVKKQFNMEMDSQLRSAYNVTVPERY